MQRTRLEGTPEPMHSLDGQGSVKIAADAWGNEGDPLVLLQHGGGQTRHAWKGTGEKLAAQGFRAYALDARGHGDSDWAADGNYLQEAMVADVVSVAHQLSQNKPILVGASMGGGVSLCAVGQEKIAAAALVLVDTAPQIEPAGANRILEFMGQKPDGFDSLEEVAQAISTYQPHRKKPQNLDGLKKNIRLDETGRLRWHWDPHWLNGGRGQDRMRRGQQMQAAAENLARLKIPTLLVRGGL